MEKTVLVGLGDIASHHNPGLRHSAMFDLVAVCDINEKAPSRDAYNGLPFYTDLRRMLEAEKPDVAIIATPPATHYELISTCASMDVRALVEKPIAASKDEYNALKGLLDKGMFNIIYHWIFSSEILWFKRSIRFLKAKKLHISIEDPYADAQGNIYRTRRFMGGCWLDSGVNALSIISLWIDLSTIENLKVEHERTKDGIPVATKASFKSGETEVSIDISWKTGRNFKETTMLLGNDTYILRHSEQKVIKNGTEIFHDDSMPRLDRHYYNFYSLYPSSLIAETTTSNIHRILYDNL